MTQSRLAPLLQGGHGGLRALDRVTRIVAIGTKGVGAEAPPTKTVSALAALKPSRSRSGSRSRSCIAYRKERCEPRNAGAT
ncbi:DUF6053 domain-containing protein [Lysobacter capsici]|uniref:DUF6053 domain-containing protein n=1 Tax=Lysobacter capsici TaxID=435897 RepID=UPI003D2F80A9